MPGNARCDACDKKFPSLRLLSAHQATAECPATLSDVVCDICGLQMPHGIVLKKHQQQCRSQLVRQRQRRDSSLGPMERAYHSHGGVKKRRRTAKTTAKKIVRSHRRLVEAANIGLSLIPTNPVQAGEVIRLAVSEAIAVLSDVRDEFPEEATPLPMAGVQQAPQQQQQQQQHQPAWAPRAAAVAAPGLQSRAAPATPAFTPMAMPMTSNVAALLAAGRGAPTGAPVAGPAFPNAPFFMPMNPYGPYAAAALAAAAAMRQAVPTTSAARSSPSARRVPIPTARPESSASPVAAVPPATPIISQPVFDEDEDSEDSHEDFEMAAAKGKGLSPAVSTTDVAPAPPLAEDQEVPFSPAVARDNTSSAPVPTS